MMLLIFTAFLSCAIMASVMPKELIDLVKSIPAQDEFLIYDIRGDLSSDEVLAAFSGFNVPYKFKAWGVISLPSYVLGRAWVEADINFGGPYQTQAVTTPIVNIY
nr:hypothetical protein BaRGS_007705 [Batillaria attramentaria]